MRNRGLVSSSATQGSVFFQGGSYCAHGSVHINTHTYTHICNTQKIVVKSSHLYCAMISLQDRGMLIFCISQSVIA